MSPKKMTRKQLVRKAFTVGMEAGRKANGGFGYTAKFNDIATDQRIAFSTIVDYVVDAVKAGKVVLAILLACLPMQAQEGAIRLHWDPVLDQGIESYNVYVNDGLAELVPQNTKTMVSTTIQELPTQTPLSVYVTSVSKDGVESAPSKTSLVTIDPASTPSPPISIIVTIPGELQTTVLVASNAMILEMSTDIKDWKPLLDLRVLDDRFVPMVMTFRFPGHLEGALFFRATP